STAAFPDMPDPYGHATMVGASGPSRVMVGSADADAIRMKLAAKKTSPQANFRLFMKYPYKLCRAFSGNHRHNLPMPRFLVKRTIFTIEYEPRCAGGRSCRLDASRLG